MNWRPLWCLCRQSKFEWLFWKMVIADPANLLGYWLCEDTKCLQLPDDKDLDKFAFILLFDANMYL